MVRLVISTVGTSLLTNQIDRDIDPDNWYKRLQQTANYTAEEVSQYHEDVSQIIEELKQRAEEKLYSHDTDVEQIREASAELNGIYGLYDLYNEQLEQGISDTHLLVTTDTAQGRITAELVESFLKTKGLNNTSICIQSGLSTASSNTFVEGIAKLITSMQETIYSFKKSQYPICFNLVGGFKALQGYFNTIGMFYADEIIYVFEGSNEVITIPRLPIQVNQSKVEPYKVQLAMMDVGEIHSFWEEAQKVPKDWVLVDGQEMILSTWGQLIWNQCKDDILSQKLLKFPRVDYKSSFLDDYKKIENNIQEKVKLQETIAKVAQLLQKSSGDISILKQDTGLQYDKYTNKGNIDHFRVTQGLRVSCTSSSGVLLLHRYGKEPDVNKNPY
jgi:putative CRISPR-associated protein (TIGR02619 family)